MTAHTNYGYQIGSATPIPLLNPHTIVVVNADVAQSVTDANTYCALRGIPASNIRSFHFGTNNYPVYFAGLKNSATPAYSIGSQTISSTAAYNGIASGSALLTVLANEISNYGALCIIFSTYTPTNYVGSASGTGQWPLPAICGAAVFVNAQSSFDANQTNSGAISTSYVLGLTTSLTAANLASNNIPYNWSSLTNLRPHGRLGFPDLTQTALAEVPLQSGAATVFQNAVVNALAYEKTNNMNLPVYYTSSGDTQISLVQATCNQYGALFGSFVLSQGFGNTQDTGSISTSTGATIFKGQSLTGSLAYNLKTNNPLAPNLPKIWCGLLAQQMSNYNVPLYTPNVNSPEVGNFTVLPGAFLGLEYSYTQNFCGYAMYNGASAVKSTVGEPYRDGNTSQLDMLSLMINQRVPLALANAIGPSAYIADYNGQNYALGNTIFGDPLYSPFYSTFTTGWGAARGLLGAYRNAINTGVS